MRKFYLFAAAAVLLTACVKTQNLDEVTPIGADESAVSFDVYTARATKAGMPKEITTARLQDINGPGFGVFAYYTDNGKYDQYAKPNFMYNQQVKYNGSDWTYEPVKYWPNETGDAAVSDDKDYVSFFAYAPYVISDPSTGAVKIPDNFVYLDEAEEQRRNITGMISNSTMGDPKIEYVVDFNPATSVDLLWGVDENNESMPFLNQEKPKTMDKTKFFMRHALVKLNVQIDAFVDGTNATQKVADSTKIYVRSVTFEGFATKGALNLNNTTRSPLWLDYNGIDNLLGEPVTILDGRKDGKEGYKDGEATREKVVGIDSILVQSAPYTEKTKVTPGVTNKPANLFTPIDRTAAHPENDPIYVIPNGDPVKITIVYDVETQDCKLAGYLSDGVTHGSTIENTITKEIKYPNDNNVIMMAGWLYTFKLHLGMTSVKVDAEVKTWADNPDDIHDVNLPANTN